MAMIGIRRVILLRGIDIHQDHALRRTNLHIGSGHGPARHEPDRYQCLNQKSQKQYEVHALFHGAYISNASRIRQEMPLADNL